MWAHSFLLCDPLCDVTKLSLASVALGAAALAALTLLVRLSKSWSRSRHRGANTVVDCVIQFVGEWELRVQLLIRGNIGSVERSLVKQQQECCAASLVTHVPQATQAPSARSSTCCVDTCAGATELVGRREVVVEFLSCCSVPQVGRCAAVSRDFHLGAARDDLWRVLCLRRWRGRQHSVHMRRWFAESALVAEDLFVEYGEEEQLRRCQAVASRPWPREPERCRVASWRDRFIFAERDARRSAITLEELCWDSPFAFDKRASQPSQPSVVQASDRSRSLNRQGCHSEGAPAHSWNQRRWAVTMYFDQSFEMEAFFHHTGEFTDTCRFLTRSTPWHFAYGSSGDVMIQVFSDRPELPVLRAQRTSDWGWRFVSAGQRNRIAVFTSRQLGPNEHKLARSVHPHIVTLYLRRCEEASKAHAGIFGAWRCLAAYQGTMPTASWRGRLLTIQPGLLLMKRTDGGSDTFRCTLDEESGTMDIFCIGDDGEEWSAARGIFRFEENQQVLVACRNEMRGGPRPTGAPLGLPDVKDVLRADDDEVAEEGWALHGFGPEPREVRPRWPEEIAFSRAGLGTQT